MDRGLKAWRLGGQEAHRVESQEAGKLGSY